MSTKSANGSTTRTHSPAGGANRQRYDVPGSRVRVCRHRVYVRPSPRTRKAIASPPVSRSGRSGERTEQNPPLFSSDTHPRNAAWPSAVRANELHDTPPISPSSAGCHGANGVCGQNRYNVCSTARSGTRVQGRRSGKG